MLAAFTIASVLKVVISPLDISRVVSGCSRHYQLYNSIGNVTERMSVNAFAGEGLALLASKRFQNNAMLRVPILANDL